jgi:mannose-6-phosphate isomerase-like protein (cupin superfamily)
MKPSVPTILPPGGGTIHNVLGAPYRFLITSADTAGAFSLIEIVTLPQSGVPLHVHTREDETFFILEGQLEVQCGDSAVTVDKGFTAFLPRNIPHAYRNTTNTPTKYLVFITPGGFEKCLEEFARLPVGPPAPEKLVEIGQKYGLRFPPPEA